MTAVFFVYLGLITLFVFPLPVSFSAYTLDIGEKIRITFNVSNFYKKYIEFGGERGEKAAEEVIKVAESGEKKIKKNLKIKIDFKTAVQNLDKVSFDYVKIDLTVPENLPLPYKCAAFFALDSVEKVLKAKNFNFATGKSYLHVGYGDGARLFVQTKIRVKLNLLIIFSLIFQILSFRKQ